MSARQILSAKGICLDLCADTPRAVIAAVAGLLMPNSRFEADQLRHRFERGFARRSAALGQGILLLRSSLAHLSGPRAAWVRCRPPLRVETPDGVPVVDVLALVVPRPALSADHDLLSALERWLRQPGTAQVLRTIDDEARARDLLIEAVASRLPAAA